MQRNRTGADYVTKHRIPRHDMIFEGCIEVTNEKGEATTIKQIMNGMNGNDACDALRLSLTTTKKEQKPKTVYELKQMMLDNERARNENEDESHRDNTNCKLPRNNYDKKNKHRNRGYNTYSYTDLDEDNKRRNNKQGYHGDKRRKIQKH